VIRFVGDAVRKRRDSRVVLLFTRIGICVILLGSRQEGFRLPPPGGRETLLFDKGQARCKDDIIIAKFTQRIAVLKVAIRLGYRTPSLSAGHECRDDGADLHEFAAREVR
jgi:hypothetical protein